MGKKNFKNYIVLAIIAILIVSSFAYLSNKGSSKEESTSSYSPVQEILSRNLDTTYPATPKEVLKLYSEITRCFYGETYTEEELTALAVKSRELFDAELAANQSEEDYIQSLKDTIASYKADKRTISSYSVSSSANVEYYNYKNAQWARLGCIYSMKVNGKIEPSQEDFLLRKDAEGHWKIFGWKLVEEEDTNE